ncbi:phospholipase D-like domain-containing protein, partial [Serratia marcescens]|uniref:phospholipase D-like domain-containing protein n=1 Tax=Serratia marcescens TaxID=615 RepID=UPI002813EAC7
TPASSSSEKNARLAQRTIIESLSRGTMMLEAGVRIYQFEGGLLHTKSVLVDGQLSLVGTVNLDMRSLWLNFEIT